MPAITRALDVLEYCTRHAAPVSVQELAEALAIPRASVFRVVRTLEARGYLVATDERRRYSAGPGILGLANSITHEDTLRRICGPYLYRLATETRQTVQLGVLFGYRVLYIDQIRTPTGTEIFVEPTGTPFEVNISAGGKVLLAWLSPAERAEFLDHAPLRRATPNSIAERDAFEMEVRRVRDQGYALDDQEFAIGIRCVAAPVLNESGSCVASIGITGHVSRLHDQALPTFVRSVRQTARDVSQALGGAGAGTGEDPGGVLR